MVTTNGLLMAEVSHARQRPRQNRFNYGMYYLCTALDEWQHLGNAKLISHNKPNLFSVYDKDHGAHDGSPAEPWIRGILAKWGVTTADGRIVLLTLPRVMGYVFNPVSFWFCLDKQGQLRAVLSEVSNTFRDRHSYLSFHSDQRPITQDDWMQAEKIFHVSPFIEIKGHYQFRFAYREDKIGVWIDYYDEDGLMLTTSLTGKRIPLTAGALLRCFLRYPLVTVKVIALIHYQALKLWLKGIRYHARKPLPPTEVSR